MKKFALLFVVAVLSFGFVGCVSSPPPPKSNWWTEADNDKQAMISRKEILTVPTKDHPVTEVTEHRIELSWIDMRRGTFPSAWVVVDVETYQSVNLGDFVLLKPWYADKTDDHVRVYYFWDLPSGQQRRVDYEYEDLETFATENQ